MYIIQKSIGLALIGLGRRLYEHSSAEITGAKAMTGCAIICENNVPLVEDLRLK
jgi:hypothetical protein